MSPPELDEYEVKALLVVAMSYDNRKPGEATVAAWREAAARGRWSFGEAREAIHQHYAESTDFLMPAHITATIRAARRQPAPVAQITQAQSIPAQPERIRDVMREIATRFGWPDRSAQDHPALKFACPHCGAAIGKRCARQLARGHRRGQYIPIASPHPSRISLLETRP